MGFHFDGLASVLKFEVARDGKSVSYQAKPFLSNAYVRAETHTPVLRRRVL
jgi:hypothetical protein